MRGHIVLERNSGGIPIKYPERLINLNLHLLDRHLGQQYKMVYENEPIFAQLLHEFDFGHKDGECPLIPS